MASSRRFLEPYDHKEFLLPSKAVNLISFIGNEIQLAFYPTLPYLLYVYIFLLIIFLNNLKSPIITKKYIVQNVKSSRFKRDKHITLKKKFESIKFLVFI